MSGKRTYKTRWVMSRLDHLKRLPKPDEEFTKHDALPRVTDIRQQILSHNVLESKTKVRGAEYPDGGQTVWATRTSAYEKIKDLLENRPEYQFPALPCGDRGAEKRNGRFHCKMNHYDDGEHHKSWRRAELEYYYKHKGLPESASDSADDGEAEVVRL